MLKNPRLRVVNSSMSGQEFPIPEHPVIVGRSSGCDIVIADQSISRQHVRAEIKDGKCVLKDLGSHNGIYLNGSSTRTAELKPGERFELGDIAIEFRAEETAQASAESPDQTVAMPAQPEGMVPPDGYQLAVQGAQLPGERAVSVDEIFGGGAGVAKPAEGTPKGPGEEEKAAVEGARGTLGYLLAIVVVVVLGIIAWNAVGTDAVEEDIKQINLRVGEKVVMDLGLRYRISNSGRIVNYINEYEAYSQYQFVNPEGNQICSFEIDRTQFMATIEGLSFGWTDVRLVSPRGREATVRIIVQGEVPGPAVNERMNNNERLSRGRLLYQSGKTAIDANALYVGIQRLKEAEEILRPVGAGEAVQLKADANQLAREARKKLDEEFERIKQQAISRINNGDYRGAAKDWERLRLLIPDEKDEMNQKLKIIFERTIQKMRQN